MQNKNVFAVIIGVGNYEQTGVANLPTYKMDLAMIGTAPEEYILSSLRTMAAG